MTLICYDSIYAKNLPAGADAYLGYVDGYWPDYQDEVQKFSSAYIIGLTVFDSQQGEGCDIEKGDLTVQQGAQWIHDAQGRVTRPIAYASVSNMAQLVSELDALNVSRSNYRLFSAHYDVGPHICGPSTCRYPGAPQADATQWTSTAKGLNASSIDESWLSDSFFTGTPAHAPVPQPVPQVPPARRNIFTPVVEDGVFGSKTCSALQFVVFNGNIADVDGWFGPLTKVALQKHLSVQPDGVIGPRTIRAIQQRCGVPQDGVWGPLTTKGLQVELNKGLF